MVSKNGLMSPRQAATYLGLSHFTLRNWRAQRIHLPFIRIGVRSWYRPEDVEAFKQEYHTSVGVGKDS